MTPPSTSGSEPLPVSPEELAEELAAMLRTGVTVHACRTAPRLCGLAVVHAKAATPTPNDLAVSASNLIREACAAVDDIASGPTAILLGVAPGYRGQFMKDRRRDAADAVHVSADHFRRDRELPLVEAVADEIYARDSAYRLRHRHRTEAEREPTATRLGIDWREQHRSYRRIWTPVTGLRNDLLVLLEYFRAARAAGLSPYEVGEDARANVSDRLSSMTWYLARFSTELRRFVEREGGLWLLADAESEILAADAIYRLEQLLPFGEADVSWARGLLAASTNEELDPFIELLMAERSPRQEFMATWVEWAWTATPVTLSGGELKSTTDCGRWLGAGEAFIQLIDADWYHVSDWYRQHR